MKFKLVEAFNKPLNREQLISALKDIGKRCRFEKYSDAQLQDMLDNSRKELESFSMLSEAEKKKQKKQKAMGWFQSFNDHKKKPQNNVKTGNFDPEKETQIFNHLTGADKVSSKPIDATPVAGDSGSSGGEAAGDGGGMGESFELNESGRPFNPDGTPTKKALMLAKLLKDGEARKSDLLQFAGDPNYARPGQWSTAWADMNRSGLIASNPNHRGYIIPGPNLADWFKNSTNPNFDVDDYIAQEEQAGLAKLASSNISLENDVAEFPDDFFEGLNNRR